jgi:hypothetical protein
VTVTASKYTMSKDVAKYYLATSLLSADNFGVEVHSIIYREDFK